MELAFLEDTSIITLMLILSFLRVWMEILGIQWQQMPLGKFVGAQKAEKIHRWGLYICLGNIILFAPQVLLS